MKTCFVVIGYGEKIDPVSNKLVNLDKTYTSIIKPAFEAQGYNCNRSIDLNKSGSINKRMIRDIFFSDFVLVDLTTFNPNVMYELGVRHALKPYSTILICDEDSMEKIPFNIQSLVIHPYQHLGKGIDFDEVVKQKKKLRKIIKALEKTKEQDSPIFDFIPTLKVSSKKDKRKFEIEFHKSETSIGSRIEEAEWAKDNKDYKRAKVLYQELLEDSPNDPFLTKRLALVTYKAKLPNEQKSLLKAKRILNKIDQSSAADPEATGLLGAIYKRLFEITGNQADLEHSIKSYRKGYLVNEDYYNGINYAFVLDKKSKLEKNKLNKRMIQQESEQVKKDIVPLVKKKMKKEKDPVESGWLKLTLAEVQYDLGDPTLAKKILAAPKRHKLNDFQIDSFSEQIKKKGLK